ncbi:MAG: HD domain-containing protein [Candidatus Yonathbacteria bacterium]|nr:HD domain-containing protein [Candidatus Yonathbacteria bacterium]NTW48007.1 HD domain-containing protein [Candidatus Yonathbacteria bacterium]
MEYADDTESIYDFLKYIRQFETTYRFTTKPGSGFESDAEHSWSVAFACMLLAGRLEHEFGVHLDQARMLNMALVHDLAEMIAGDTKPWDEKARIGKNEREQDAIVSIVKNLPKDMRENVLALWEESEQCETLEAKIVKSLDKLDPEIHRVTHHIAWQEIMDEIHATREACDARHIPHHSFSTTLTSLYETTRKEALEKGMLKAEKTSI